MPEPILYPRPQWLRWREGAPLTPPPGLVVLTTERAALEAAHLCQWLRAEHSLEPCMALWPQEGAQAMQGAILVGLLGEPQVEAALASRGVRPDGREQVHEGYLLDVQSDGALVAGHDGAGAYYAAQCLRGLCASDGARTTLFPVEIHDWPYKPLRGIHLYMPPRAQLGFFERLLETLATLRFNTLFLEVGGGMRYERHPEINSGWEEYVRRITALPGFVTEAEHGFPFPKDSTHYELAGGSFLEKDEVRGLIEAARARHIEVLPEVQSLSHSYYLCVPHPEIAENAADPFPDTYCPSNPDSYALLFDVLDEVIEVFQPRLVHTGHDELYTLGLCPRCRGQRGAALLASDLNRIHDFLAPRGIRMALWGDKLMNIIVGGRPMGGREYTVPPGTWFRNTEPYTIIETYAAIEQVPKDMLILNWYWAVDPRATEYFVEHGFEQIFGNFYHHGGRSFRGWEEQAAEPSVLGAEVSTWCEVSEWALGHNACFFNLAFAAQPLWWSHYSDAERGRTLAQVAALQPRLRQRSSGQLAPSLTNGARFQPCPLPAETVCEAIAGLPQGETVLSGVPWHLGPTRANAQRVDAAQPQAAPIPVGGCARSLLFLYHSRCQRRYFHTYGDIYIVLPTPDGVLGWVAVRYADGSEERFEVRFGENIANGQTRFGEHVTACPYWAEPAWEGEDEEGRPVVLYRTEWINPHPEKAIESVHLQWAGGEGEMWLAGVTAVA